MSVPTTLAEALNLSAPHRPHGMTSVDWADLITGLWTQSEARMANFGAASVVGTLTQSLAIPRDATVVALGARWVTTSTGTITVSVDGVPADTVAMSGISVNDTGLSVDVAASELLTVQVAPVLAITDLAVSLEWVPQ